MKNLKIEINEANETIAPLYMQYPGDLTTQPAYLEFHLNKDDNEFSLLATYNSAPGGVSATSDSLKGYSIIISLDSNISRTSLESLNNCDRFKELLTELENAEKEDQRDIVEGIQNYLEINMVMISIYSIGEYLPNSNRITEQLAMQLDVLDETFIIGPFTSDKKLAEMAVRVSELVDLNCEVDQLVLGDYEEYLEELKKELQEHIDNGG